MQPRLGRDRRFVAKSPETAQAKAQERIESKCGALSAAVILPAGGRAGVKARVFVGDPAHKGLYILVGQKGGDRRVALGQFALGEQGVDLAVADAIQDYCLAAFQAYTKGPG